SAFVLGSRFVLLFLALGLERPAHARTQRRVARARRLRVRPTFGGEILGRGAVRNVVAANFVARLLQQRVVEEFDEALLAVVHDALRVTLVIVIGAIALFAKADRVAIGRRGQRIVGILLERHAVGLDRHGALRDDHVADQF